MKETSEIKLVSECNSFKGDIYIAGDYSLACSILRKYCEKGFCVSVSKKEYIYTYGQESGIVVTIINYPRFKRSVQEIKDECIKIAKLLIEKLSQGSCSIVFDDETLFFSRRECDL